MPKTDPAATADVPEVEVAASEEPTVEPIDDGEAGALAAYEQANYARAHTPNPIREE